MYARVSTIIISSWNYNNKRQKVHIWVCDLIHLVYWKVGSPPPFWFQSSHTAPSWHPPPSQRGFCSFLPIRTERHYCCSRLLFFALYHHHRRRHRDYFGDDGGVRNVWWRLRECDDADDDDGDTDLFSEYNKNKHKNAPINLNPISLVLIPWQSARTEGDNVGEDTIIFN